MVGTSVAVYVGMTYLIMATARKPEEMITKFVVRSARSTKAACKTAEALRVRGYRVNVKKETK